jgi:hypothetical protein
MSSTIKTFSITISIDKNECSYLNQIFEFWVPISAE